MNQKRLSELLAEIKRRQGVAPSFLDHSFPLQCRLVEQPQRFQGWQATRRAAKSNSFARRMLRRITRKKCNALYLALTLDSAKAILWDVVEQLLIDNKVEFQSNKQAGTFTLGNGSFIKFAGLDSNFKEMRKILGQKYAIVGIDECGSMTQDMETIVRQMITPALIDEMGDLILLGTAENIPNTFFERVMRGDEPGFHTETWDTYQNPYMAKNWEAEVNRILSENPLAKEASWFKTHYLNMWCTDDELKVYQLADYNIIPSAPNKPRPTYTIGIDLGWDDASAFVVTAYFKGDPTLYVVKSFKSPELDITATANAIKGLLKNFPSAALVVDGANKQAVEEMRNRHGLGLEAADKTAKSDFMRIMRDDLIESRIQIVEPQNGQLLEEMRALMWLKGTDDEDPRCQNHLCDALLYNWRNARSYIEKPEVVEWKSESTKMAELEQLEAKRLDEERREMSLLY